MRADDYVPAPQARNNGSPGRQAWVRLLGKHEPRRGGTALVPGRGFLLESRRLAGAARRAFLIATEKGGSDGVLEHQVLLLRGLQHQRVLVERLDHA